MKNSKRLLSLLVIIFAAIDMVPEAEAKLSATEVYNRCHSKIVRTFPKSRTKLKNFKTVEEAVAACQALLDGFALNQSTGMIELRNNVYDQDTARQILQSFNEVHVGWFANRNLFNSTQDPGSGGLKNIWDEDSAGLYFTNALFGNGVPAKSVVIGNQDLDAIRDNRRQQAPIPFPPGRHTVVGPDNGILSGITTRNAARGGNNGRNFEDEMQSGTGDYKIYMAKHFGGGALGSPTYLMLNNGLRPLHTLDAFGSYEYRHYRGSDSNGGLRLQRHFGKNVLNDFLCKSLPAVRVADAVTAVVSPMKADTPAFRGSATCMSCHVPMDTLSYTVRGYVGFGMRRDNIDGGAFAETTYVGVANQNGQKADRSLVENQSDFFRRDPWGNLIFRSYTGDLVKGDALPGVGEIVGVAKVGEAIASSRDFYACTVSRYLEYFTGTHVDLNDTSYSYTGRSNFEKKADPALLFVDELAGELQQHQDTKKIINRILGSKYFVGE